MTDPVAIIGELQSLTASLDEASKQLYTLEKNFGEVEEEFDDVFNDLLVAYVAPYEEEDGKLKRLPGEDVRNAIITKQIRKEHPDLFGRYRSLRKELERGEKRCKRIERQIGSYQSQLKSLATEAGATRA